MTVKHGQELPHRPVVRDGVTHGLYALEPEPALGVRYHDAPLAGLIPALMLHVVVARAVRLPDVDLDAFHRAALGVLDGAEAEEGLALRVMGHLLAVGEGRGIVGVEGAQDRALG